MAITGGLIPEGTRIRIRRGQFPVDPSLLGRTGTVVDTSEYRPHAYGVLLDGESEQRFFAPAELEATEERALRADREAAKRRPALP
jgi:hypothetical protein